MSESTNKLEPTLQHQDGSHIASAERLDARLHERGQIAARRSQLEVLMDMLRAVNDGAEKPTQIMYRANLSWATLQRCLHALLERGLIQEVSLGHRKKFEVTSRGSQILSSYLRALEEFRRGLHPEREWPL